MFQVGDTVRIKETSDATELRGMSGTITALDGMWIMVRLDEVPYSPAPFKPTELEAIVQVQR